MIISITGHRPKYFAAKPDGWLEQVKENVKNKLGKDRPSAIIQGGCTGFDLIVAEIGLQMGIPIRTYVPFVSQAKYYSPKDLETYNNVLDNSDAVFICSKKFSKYAYIKRDRLMVDHGDQIYCLYDVSKPNSGTGHTVKFAKDKGMTVTNFWQ